ncbi:MAG: FtsX-like permease family protein [Planctomycetota bacterium]
MTLLGLVAKNLMRRPFRTIMTMLALATAIGSVMALSGVAGGFTDSFRDVYQSHRVDLVVTRDGSADRLSSSLPDRYVQTVKECTGVDRAAGVLLETLSLEQQQVFGIPSMGMPLDSWLFADYELVEQSSSDSGAARIYLGQNVAQRTGLSAGDPVEIFEEPAFVAGIYTTASVWENGSIILPLETLQLLTGREGQITYINVAVDESIDQDQIRDVTEAIESADPKLLALPTETFVQSDTRMQLAGGMAWMTSVIALVVGVIGTLNTMMTSVMERTGEIGILRAVGWTVRQVASLILLESVVLSVIATVIGGIGGTLLLMLLAANDAAGGMLQPRLDLSLWIRGLGIGLGIGLIGAALPSYRASRMHPTLALRQL